MKASRFTESAKATDTLDHGHWSRSIAGLAAVIVAVLSVHFSAFAQQARANGIRLADDVVPAPDGYEMVTVKYTTAISTDLYISPFFWAGKVLGIHLNAGQPVDVLAKPKGYDWLLVGKNGTGIGYVPISVLSPAKQ
jgi:hypothetical protein